MGEPMTEAALFAIDALQKSQSDAEQQLSAIAAAIGSSRFMDPPDGGDVRLAEQVTRMREALEKAEAALAQSGAEPCEHDWHIWAEDHQFQRCRKCGAYHKPPAQSDAEPVAWEYKTADGWQRISLKNYKILKGSSFELRPIFKVGRRPTRSRT